METVLGYLFAYKYYAMFGLLLLCGLGLPIPEEVTLISSGLLVGWGKADFFLASLTCVIAIIVGDSVPFFLGRFFGRRLLGKVLSKERNEMAANAFEDHRLKTVFFARFVAGFRIPVYAYAGSHGMSWFKFALLDLLGALISGPTSVWIGKIAAEKVREKVGSDDPQEAIKYAQELSGNFHFWLYLVLGSAALFATIYFLHKWFKKKLLQPRKNKPADEKNAE